ncbi:hypothetical protein V1477_013269 [Vespula maculifrons]|uniref:Uncharacterized protein n=1 Tax=Vespula maculifrons TaxID=7453 RepID=A0ABD2BVF8_VESMC
MFISIAGKSSVTKIAQVYQITSAWYNITFDCCMPGTFNTEIIIRNNGKVSSIDESINTSLRNNPSNCVNNPLHVAAPGPKPASNGKQSK